MPSKSVGAEDLEKVKRVVFSFGRVRRLNPRSLIATPAAPVAGTSTPSNSPKASIGVKPPGGAQGVRRAEMRRNGGPKQAKPSPSDPLSMPPAVERRNARERNRVKLVNDGYDALRRRIPLARENKKMSKVDILRSAVDYIRQLQWVVDSPSSSGDGILGHQNFPSSAASWSPEGDNSSLMLSDDDDASMNSGEWPLSFSALESSGCGSDKENASDHGSPKNSHKGAFSTPGDVFSAHQPVVPIMCAEDENPDEEQTVQRSWMLLPPIDSVFEGFASVKDDAVIKTDGGDDYSEFQAFFDHQLLNVSTSSNEDERCGSIDSVPGLIRAIDHQRDEQNVLRAERERQVPQGGPGHEYEVHQVAFSCF